MSHNDLSPFLLSFSLHTHAGTSKDLLAPHPAAAAYLKKVANVPEVGQKSVAFDILSDSGKETLQGTENVTFVLRDSAPMWEADRPFIIHGCSVAIAG